MDAARYWGSNANPRALPPSSPCRAGVWLESAFPPDRHAATRSNPSRQYPWTSWSFAPNPIKFRCASLRRNGKIDPRKVGGEAVLESFNGDDPISKGSSGWGLRPGLHRVNGPGGITIGKRAARRARSSRAFFYFHPKGGGTASGSRAPRRGGNDRLDRPFLGASRTSHGEQYLRSMSYVSFAERHPGDSTRCRLDPALSMPFDAWIR